MSPLRRRGSDSNRLRTARYGLFAALALALFPAIARAEGPLPPGLANLDFRKLLEAGGGVGVVIGALSVGMAALVFEYLISLRRGATIPRRLAERLQELITQKQFKQAADECRDNGSLLALVIGAGLGEVDAGYAAVEKAMEDACAQHAGRLYRKIDYLSVIGTLSPMLGLLGTVWGMMIAFSEFASKANVAGHRAGSGHLDGPRDDADRTGGRHPRVCGLRLLSQPGRRGGGQLLADGRPSLLRVSARPDRPPSQVPRPATQGARPARASAARLPSVAIEREKSA